MYSSSCLSRLSDGRGGCGSGSGGRALTAPGLSKMMPYGALDRSLCIMMSLKEILREEALIIASLAAHLLKHIEYQHDIEHGSSEPRAMYLYNRLEPRALLLTYLPAIYLATFKVLSSPFS